VPITSTSPASNYWGIDQSITYGSGGESILSSTAGIVDTGTTLVLIATGSALSPSKYLGSGADFEASPDAFQKYQKATGATLDKYVTFPSLRPPFLITFYHRTTGLLKLTASEFENLQSLFFDVGGVQYELTPNAQIWPRELNSQLGGTEGNIYLVVSDLGSQSGQGLDFISTCSPLCSARLFSPQGHLHHLNQMALRSCNASTACSM
jgi:hypothetical protein